MPSPGESRAAAAPRRGGVVALMRWLLAIEATMYSALTPMLPHFERVLGASKAQLGVLTACYSAALIPGSVLGGWMSVRFGVRRTTIAGILIFAVAAPAFGFADRLWALDLIRAVQGVGCGLVWVGGLAWIVAAAPSSRRGEMLGTAMGAAIFGMLIGPLLGVAAVTVSTELVFVLIGLAALIAGLAMARWPEPAQPDRTASAPLRTLLASRAARVGLWVGVLDAVSFGALGVLLPLRLARFGASTIAIGGVFVLSCLISMYVSPATGRLSDRRGLSVPAAVGLLCSAALLAILPLLGTVPALGVLSAILMGAPLSAFIVPSLSLLTESAQATGVALAVATMLFNLAFALGETVGAPGGAVLAQATSDAVPLLALAGLMLATLPAVATGAFGVVPARGTAAAARGSSAAAAAAAYAEEIAD